MREPLIRALVLVFAVASCNGFLSPNIDSYFTGDILSDRALKYSQQKEVIDAVAIGANEQRPILEVIGDIAKEIEVLLDDRSYATHLLADAAKNSSTDGNVPSCCSMSDGETFYSSYYKAEVDMEKMCYLGSCRLAGRSMLGGTPDCSKMTVSGKIFEQIKHNSDFRAGSAWQYYGSETGASTVFPASVPASCPSEYDPRLRPWYATALTKDALDVVVVFDNSKSMKDFGRIENAKAATKTILTMLRPFDRFAVTAFNSYPESNTTTGELCMDRKLVYATMPNVKRMSAFVDTIHPQGGTFYGYGIEFAQHILVKSSDEPAVLRNEKPGTRKKVLMFISDGAPNDSSFQIMKALKTLFEKVPNLILMTYGLSLTESQAVHLKTMANQDYASVGLDSPAPAPLTGSYNMITPNSMRVDLGTFYTHPLISDNSSAVRWSLPYSDLFGMGLMMTASKAVKVNNVLQGVVGYDITLKVLMEPVEQLITETTYAFMVEADRGYVIYHPNLVNPSAAIGNFPPVHFSMLEPQAGLVSEIDKVIEGTVQNITYSGVRDKVDLKDGVMTKNMKPEKENFEATCQRVSSSYTEARFVICVVQVGLPKKTLSAFMFNDKNPETTGPAIYHRELESVLLKTPCQHGPRIATSEAGSLKFSSRQYEDPSRYRDLQESATQIRSVSEFLRGTKDVAEIPNPISDGVSAKAHAVLTSMFDTQWKEQDKHLHGQYSGFLSYFGLTEKDEVPVWRYYGGLDGTFRLYPGSRLANAYDPTERSWFKRTVVEARNNPAKATATFISTPYLDGFGMGYVVTVSRAIRYKGNEEIAGVFGTDFYLGQIGKMVDSLAGRFDTTQLLVDATGSVIWWDRFAIHSELVNVYDERDGVIALGLDDLGKVPVAPWPWDQEEEEVSLARALVQDGVGMLTCHDAISLTTRKALDLAGFMGAEDVKEITGGQIKAIQGTNTFMIKLNYQIKPITVDIEQFYDAYYDEAPHANFYEPDELKGFGLGYLKRTTDYKVNIFKPDGIKYDTCENRFDNVGITPSCYSDSTAFLDNSYLGSFNITDGAVSFTGENTDDLKPCFSFMSDWTEYAMYPRAGPGPGWVKLRILVTALMYIGILALVCYGYLQVSQAGPKDDGADTSDKAVPLPAVPELPQSTGVPPAVPGAQMPMSINLNITNTNENTNN